MYILHGTWIPDEVDGFVQAGQFYLWVETETAHHLQGAELASFLVDALEQSPLRLGPRQAPEVALAEELVTCDFWLPSQGSGPLPSWEMAQYLELEPPKQLSWQAWSIECYPAIATLRDGIQHSVVALLKQLHFLTQHQLSDVQMGSDLLFWYHYTQQLRQIVERDQYIPALKYRATGTAASSMQAAKGKKAAKSKAAPTFEIYPGWEIVSEAYEGLVQRYGELMPPVCGAGFLEAPAQPSQHSGEQLLRHFSEYWLTTLVSQTSLPASFTKHIRDTLLEDCLTPDGFDSFWDDERGLSYYHQWREWRDRLTDSQTPGQFILAFKLCAPELGDSLEASESRRSPRQAEVESTSWQLVFQVAPVDQPSDLTDLDTYWQAKPKQRKALKLGADFETELLRHLGYAARMYNKIWQGLETEQPGGVELSLPEACEFLQEAAWVLEDSGYRVVVPAGWTPQGRRRARVRLRAKSGKSAKKAAKGETPGYFSQEALATYQYELALGDQVLTQAEWQQLINAKAPLVQLRGQWVMLDQTKMQQMLDFWQKQQANQPEVSLSQLIHLSASDDDEVELVLDQDRRLAEMMQGLQDKTQLREVDQPPAFQGSLRPYQRRGVSWLVYLESLGLNGCLADDMGLGKSAQVIAHLLHEHGQKLPPTLLIAPTSVVGNWGKEIEKFAPQLKFALHHGGDRPREIKEFQAIASKCDVVITSYALVRLDAALLAAQPWQRIVIDEAQNIKNPNAAQTKALLKLKAQHRIALTGTPVENRLLDLWSIFNFLNPGYLGKQAQFRKTFELPIQRDQHPQRAARLKQLVEPFILRRLKTDPTIIQDLPDKLEQKCYCNLTQEQAALYEVVVKQINQSLDEVEGIQRRGMMLATLLKLKQICNHPMQFLQDESEFTPGRSHKLQRLLEMVEAAIAEGDSLLIFTQFTEIGQALETLLHRQRYATYYLHGGTPRKKRESMIAEFQAPATPPAVFILSLKAGGVGITLTKANHVFHFDRWWNPAVEDQASDRAFRIGQSKQVFVHKFIALGTLEEKIDQMIEDKKKLASTIVGSDESWLSQLDNRAFKQLISLNRKAVLD